ncbi:MAG TPA: hypothetical protein VHV75_01110 [Solirubrobacteraceae bacterium]|nr:hypothetical protein [Solirubrobacteraceae bacterium]
MAQGAEEAAHRLAEAVEVTGARVAKSAGNAGDRATELSGQLGDRIAHTRVGGPKPKQLGGMLTRAGSRTRATLHTDGDAKLKAELVKTSHELAHESSSLGHAIDSLNAVIKANRKAAARGRTRLIGGLAIGAVLMYHFDAEHGHKRRAATARRLRGVARDR